jgi:hypothetical protein
MEAANGDHEISIFLASGARPVNIGDPPSFIDKIKLVPNTMHILGEVNHKAKTGFTVGLPPPEVIGGIFRDAATLGLIVSLDKRVGGATFSDFKRFTAEQYKARKEFPPPIPIIWNDYIVDEVQIHHAACYGAGGAIIYPDMCGENFDTILKCALQYKVEPIIMIKNADEANQAIIAGARILCIHTLDDIKTCMLRESLLISYPDIFVGSRLRALQTFSAYTEIESSWYLRDGKVNFVWPSPESLFAYSISDIYSTIIAMKSKASKEYISARRFLMNRPNEGSTEYLGDILY